MNAPLELYFHPLSSFCHKVLVALYETGVEVEPVLVNLGDARDRARFLELWPIGKFPVLRDRMRDSTVPESSTIIEYLALHCGAQALIPTDPQAALEARAMDRFFDLHIHVPMQKVTTDSLRPAAQSDAFGVDQAKALMETAYDILEARLERRLWAAGDEFTLADCAAAPALFYGNLAVPLKESQQRCRAYLRRLMARPSYARALAEAGPYFKFYPLKHRLAATYPEVAASLTAALDG